MTALGGHVQGLSDFEDALMMLGASLGASTLRSSARAAFKPVYESIRDNCPVSEEPRTVKRDDGTRVEIRPGFMKSRVKLRTRINRKGNINRHFSNAHSVVRVRAGVFGVPYVVYREFGTDNNPADNFIRKALYDNEGLVIRNIKIFLRKRIMSTVKRKRRQGNQHFMSSEFDELLI